MDFYQKSTSDVLKSLDTSKDGLSQREARIRLKKLGPNLIKIKGEPLWRKIVEPFANVFMAVLLLAASISFIKGENLDAIIIGSIMLVSAVIYYVQQFSTERILRALQKYEAQKVEVIRAGETVSIDIKNIVPGDIIILTEGEKVPADARIISNENVQVDESLLTGESTPVAKQANPLTGKKQVYEQNNILFQGSFITSGQAMAVVISTGNNTEFGQLAQLSKDRNTDSPVQQKIDKLISQIIIVIAIVAVITFCLSLLRGLPPSEALRFVLALSVSAVPESLPVAITIVLALGMRRMAKQKALVRNMRAIENIGVITTIATDKTGTLTKNKLTVQQAMLANGQAASKELKDLIILAVNSTATKKIHDPLDSAMKSFAQSHKAHIPKNYKLINNIPFEHKFAMSGNVWQQGDNYHLVIKGSPEKIITTSNLRKTAYAATENTVHSLTSQGFRVIALAHTKLNKPIKSMSELKSGSINFVGLLGVADILRPEAPKAIKTALGAGVSVRMITGDHLETAFHIGKQLGMVKHKEQVFDSRQTDNLTPEKFNQYVADARVFARVIPKHKYKILSVLKDKNITAMTGDGVNDVPALANAHVGIAMGSGSQIAKEASDIVLLDNNFRSIIAAMREGRIILGNIRRMLFYLLATNAGEVLTMLGALILGLPLPLVAVQILWVNLVTDTSLVIPLGLEPGEKNTMKTPPRSPSSPILDPITIKRMLIVASSMALVSLGTFYVFSQNHSVEYARTLTFSVLVVMQWANAFNVRSETQSILASLRVPNSKFYIGLLAAIGLQVLAMFGPLSGALHIVSVSSSHLIMTAIIAIIITLLVSELHKLYGRWRNTPVS